MLRTDAFTLLATHFAELTRMEHFYAPRLVNLHMAVEQVRRGEAARMRHLFRATPGPMSTTVEQYGIHVAQIAGFPHSIIEEAKRTHQRLKRALTHRHSTTERNNFNRPHAHPLRHASTAATQWRHLHHAIADCTG